MTKAPSLIFSPPLLAHRGASAYAPENTMSAFKLAQAMGARWLEFDVMLAACGEVVVFHDENLERTTNGSGFVHEYPYSYLKTLDAGSWFSQRFRGEGIPNLARVLDFLEESGLSANIEIKPSPGKEKETVMQVLKQVAAGHSLSQRLFSSFSLEVLKELRQQAPDCLLGLLMDEIFPDFRQMALDLRAATINVNAQRLNLSVIQMLKELNLPILAYTVNGPERALELFSCGVSAVFTDCPDKILSQPIP